MSGKKSHVNTSEPQRIDFSELVCEMEGVKRLLMLLLVKLGSDSSEIAMALGVDDSTIRKMISIRRVKRIDKMGAGKVE